jgi:glycosyltransferase involved in cell wall biosynthesis
MKTICYLMGPGGGDTSHDRLTGPQRLATELAKRLPKEFSIKYVHMQRRNKFRQLLNAIHAVRKTKAAIVHAHGSLNMAMMLRIVKMFTRKRVVLTFTDFKKNVTQNYTILNKIDKVVVQTDYALKKLAAAGVKEEKMCKAMYGVEQVFDEGKSSTEIRNLGNKIVLYYGDARHVRGFKVLLDALPFIDEKITVLLCLRGFTPSSIAGDKVCSEEEVREIVRKRENIHLMTVAEYPCPIQDIIASCDVVVLPHIENTLEPPLTLVEATHAGKPIITCNSGGNSEIVAPESIVLSEVTPEMLAATVNSMVENTPQMSERKYRWEKPVQEMVRVYEGVVETK